MEGAGQGMGSQRLDWAMDEKDARQWGQLTDHALAKAFATSGPNLRPAEVAMSDEDVVPNLITQRGGTV